ncbi:polysaccharide deacetylase [Alicyclobacillaceae bacterium I2511]|nr:polysaccharide deacetylase [Alicyclobacillaceae bacterium I2511]
MTKGGFFMTLAGFRKLRFAILKFGVGTGLALAGMSVWPVPCQQTGGNVWAANPIKQQIQWEHLGKHLALPALNARVDRVWRAIPGLNGWQLNAPLSQQATAQAQDGAIHLVWDKISPTVSLSKLPREPIYRGPDAERSASLMFNVSWGEAYIPDILRILRQTGVKATFFVDGRWVEKYPNLVKDIAQSGHAIGSHGSGHPDFRRLQDGQLRKQIVDTNQVILRVSGVNPILLAPPAGSFDGRTVRQATSAGMYTILWSVDSIDWRHPPAEQIMQRIEKQVHPGAFILLHPTASTVQALPGIIRTLQDKGYHLKTITQVVLEQRAVAPPERLSALS